jgi:hypothetical protein
MIRESSALSFVESDSWISCRCPDSRSGGDQSAVPDVVSQSERRRACDARCSDVSKSVSNGNEPPRPPLNGVELKVQVMCLIVNGPEPR